MLKVATGEISSFKFVFMDNGLIYDPTIQSTPQDITAVIRRGDYGTGPIIDGPFTYNNQPDPAHDDWSFEKNDYGEIIFNYKIPERLYEGVYSVTVTTTGVISSLISVVMYFVVPSNSKTIDSVVISNRYSTIVNQKTLYEPIAYSDGKVVMLVGHGDGIPLNEPVLISSIEEAVQLLNADYDSPLLRGVFDLYSTGCRNIGICASARMSEYTAKYSDRNTDSDIFEITTEEGNTSFYKKYYQRLTDTYQVLRDYDYIDFIVPLEASFLNATLDDGNTFINQLANFCSDYHNRTGYVAIGVIGAAAGGVSSSHIDILEQDSILANKLTTYNSNGSIATDYGRFIVPIYGEAVYKHEQLKTSYTGSVAASFAGMLSTAPLNAGVIRRKIPGAMYLFGNNMSDSEYSRLENLRINSIYRGRKTRRSVPYEVYVTNEHTMSSVTSTLRKSAQMRLVADTIRNIKEIARTHVGRFTKDQIDLEVRNLFNRYKKNNIIKDYSLNVFMRKNSRGTIIVEVSLLSSLSLNAINFAVSAGPVV